MYQQQPRQGSFRPRFNKPLIEKYLSRYNREPERFNPLQVQLLAQHADFYGLPFREITQEEADFNLFRAFRYVGEGWLQGFTTLRIGEQVPVNPYERIAKSIGRAAGYAGWFPAVGPAGIVAKGLAGKSVPLLVSKAITDRVAPRVAKAVTARAMVGGAGAVSAAAKFLSQPVVQDVALGATRLGIAGGVSGWQGGIDAMLSGMTRGMWMEAGDRLIANAVGAAIGGPVGGFSAQAIVRTLSGALWNGLPSTMRGETTPDQVYEYLLGGFFAYRDEPVHNRWAKEFYAKNSEASKNAKTPEEVPGFDSLPRPTQEEYRNLWNKNVGLEKSRMYLLNKILEMQQGITGETPDFDRLEAIARQAESTVTAALEERSRAIESQAKATEEIRILEEQSKNIVEPPVVKKPEVVVAGTKILLGEIPPSPRSPVGTIKTMARTSTEDDNTMQLDPSVVPERFFNRAWTKPAKYTDGSQTTPLPEDMFKTQEEMLAFIIEHEKAHKRVKQLSGEKQGQYEDRVNEEAAKVFQETTKEVVESGILSPEKILALQNQKTQPAEKIAKAVEDEKDKAIEEKRILEEQYKNMDEMDELLAEIKNIGDRIENRATRAQERLAPQKTQTAEKPIVVNYRTYNAVPRSGDGIVFTMRQGNKVEQFGNPFSSGKGDTIRMSGVERSVDAYVRWLSDPEAEFTDDNGKIHKHVFPERRAWILDQIDSGALDGKKLVYYKQPDVEGGKYYSHADALADFVAARRANTPATSPKMIGGFDSSGRGTPDGDGKDKAMRQVADYFIGEIKDLADVDFETNKPLRPSKSSSETSYNTIAEKDENVYSTGNGNGSYSIGSYDPSVVMLARNSEFSGKPLMTFTKESILSAHKKGARFVVGDMPGVDDAFVRYLNEIGANYTIYHAGTQARISPKTLTPTPDQRRESLTAAKTEEPMKRLEKKIVAAAIPKISLDEELIQRIVDDILANKLIAEYPEMRSDIRKYIQLRESLIEYQHDVTLSKLVPPEVLAADPFLAAQMQLSNKIITDGDTDASRSLDSISKVNSDVASMKDSESYTEFDVVAFVPSREKVGEDLLTNTDLLTKAFESGSTVISPDAISRGEMPYWKEFTELATRFGYEDRGTGIWMRKNIEDSPKRQLDEYRRGIYIYEMISSNSTESTFHQKVESVIEGALLRSGSYSEQALSSVMSRFFTEVERNPAADVLDKWIDDNPQLKISSDERALLHRYAFVNRTMEPGETYVVTVAGKLDRKKNKTRFTRDASRPIKTTRAVGLLVGGKKIRQAWAKRNSLFGLVDWKGAEPSKPHIRVTNMDVGGEVLEAFPKDYDAYRDMVNSQVYMETLKSLYEVADGTKTKDGVAAAVNYLYFGGRNDHNEMNLIAAHPSLKDWTKERIINEIAKQLQMDPFEIARQHEEDKGSFLRDFLGIRNNKDPNYAWAEKYYWDSRINTLLYLRDFNQSPNFEFIGRKGFLKGSGDFNKRLQIMLSSGAPLESDVFAMRYAEEVSLSSKPSLQIIDGEMNMLVADVDYVVAYEIAKSGDESLDGSAVDGNLWMTRAEVNAINRSAGNPVSGGVNKSFLVHSDKENGMLLGKYMIHTADAEMEAWMIENNIHVIGDDNAIKQMGNRAATKLYYDNGLKVDGEMNPFQINVKDFRIVTSEISDGSPEKINTPFGVTKQMVTNLNWETEARNDFINTVYRGSMLGSREVNAAAMNLLKKKNISDEDLLYIRRNVDNLGLDEIKRILKSGNLKLSQAIIRGILAKNPQEAEDEAYGFLSKFDETAYGGMRTLMDLGSDYAFFDKFSQNYWSQALHKYVINRATRPVIGNALQKAKNRGNLLSKYRVTQDDFILGGNYKNLAIDFYGIMNGDKETFTLGELWDMHKGIKEFTVSEAEAEGFAAKLDEFFANIAVQRVPQDNPAGMQVLKLQGFMDEDTNDIILHPYVKEATGGSDDDGDSYYAWFGGRMEDDSLGKGMKISWLNNFKKNNKMWPAGVAIKAYVDKDFGSTSDAVFGAPDKKMLTLMRNPALIGAPGIAEKSSAFTIFARQKLSEVVTNTTALNQLYSEMLDNGDPTFLFDHSIYPRNADDPRVLWAKRKMATMITKVADPTEFSSVPDLAKAYADLVFDLFEVMDKNGKEVSSRDFVVYNKKGKPTFAEDLFSVFVRDTVKEISILRGKRSFLETKLGLGRHTDNEGTWLRGASDGLRNGEWMIDFYDYIDGRIRVIAELMNRLSADANQAEAKNIYIAFSRITKHQAEISGFKEIGGEKGLFSNTKVLGKNDNNNTTIVEFSKRYLNKTLYSNEANERLFSLIEDAAKFNDVEYVRNLINSGDPDGVLSDFFAKAEGVVNKEGLTAAKLEGDLATIDYVRKSAAEMFQQNVIDTTTYLAVRGLVKNEMAKSGGWFKKEVAARWNEIWRAANGFKSDVSKEFPDSQPRKTIDEIEVEIAKYRSELLPGSERNLFDVFMLGSWQQKTRASFANDKDAPLSKQDYIKHVAKTRDATNYSQIGVSLKSIPKSSKKAFYAIPDRIFKEALSLSDADVVKASADISDIVFNDFASYFPRNDGPPKSVIEAKQRIKEKDDYIKAKQKHIDELDETIKTQKLNKIEQVITERQRMLFEQKKQSGRVIPKSEVDDIEELDKIASSIKEHLDFYKISENGDVPIEGITRGLFFKSVSKMTLNDWRALDNWFKTMRKPTFIQRIFGDKAGEQALLRKVDWFFFPEAINRRLMRTRIEWALDYSIYYDKDGKLKEGQFVLKPTAPLGQIQDIVGGVVEEGRVQIERRKARFSRALVPYLNDLGDTGKVIWEAEVLRRAIESAKTEAKFAATKSSPDPDAEKSFLQDAKILERKLNTLKKSNPLVFLRKHTVNTGSAMVEMTALEIQGKISALLTDLNKELSLIQKGSIDENGENPILEKYRLTKLKGVPEGAVDMSRIDLFDLDAFSADMSKLLSKGSSFPAEIGIDGLIRLERSLSFQLEVRKALSLSNKRESRKQLSLITRRYEKKRPVHTGELPFDQYFPQIVTDLKQIREKLEPRRLKEMRKISVLDTQLKDIREKLEELTFAGYENHLSGEELKEVNRMQQIEKSLEMDRNVSINEVIRMNQTMKYGPQAIVESNEMAENGRAHELVLQQMSAKTKAELEEIDRALSWENAAKQVRSQKRREPGQVDFDMSPENYSTHMGNVARAFHRNLSMVMGKNVLANVEARLDMGDATGSWIKFMKLYLFDSLGSPTVLTEDMIKDPEMKLQGNIYTQLADNVVGARLYSIGEKLGLIKEKSFVGENGIGYIPDELKRLDYDTLKRWSQIEAHYEMASLLAHSKSMVANLFGGSQMTMISAGVKNFFNARNIDYIRKNVNPAFENMTDVERAYIEQGLLEEYMQVEAGMISKGLRGNFKAFVEEAIGNIRKDGDVSDESLFSLAKKHKLPDSVLEKAAWFMQRSERTLRRDAFMAHYIFWNDRFGGNLKGVYDENGNWRFNPILAKLATEGVKATQFFYSAPYRPAFARTELGKVLSRFQLWTYNSMDVRKQMYEQASIYGFQPDSPEMERFSRMMAADMIVFGLAEAFAFSLFDSALPAPWNYVNDFANWIFGDSKGKERAFFGVYPYYVAPLQVATPPILRAFPPMISALVTGDWERVIDYTSWTMFPFGRLARDLHKSYLNPKSFIDRMTGFPLTKISGPDKEKEKNTNGGIK